MKNAFRVALVASALFSLTSLGEENHPCKEDREKFCKGLKMGEGLGKCMKEHEAQLSPACKAKVSERVEMRQERREERRKMREERRKMREGRREERKENHDEKHE